jgi:hypothetical protein
MNGRSKGIIGLQVALLALLSACSDRDPAGVETPDVSSEPTRILLSDPEARSLLASVSAYRSSVGLSTDDGFAYISARPRTFPSGFAADIRNLTTKSDPRRVPISDGGSSL